MSAIGIETVAGILVTVIGGEFTPLSCYVGVQSCQRRRYPTRTT